MIEDLKELDKQRINLINRKKKFLPYLYAIPLLSIFILWFLKLNPRLVFILGIVLTFGIVMPFLVYYLNISYPFKKIKGKVKQAILEEFMKTFHPEFQHTFQQRYSRGRRIAKDSGLISFTAATEEDVVEGSHHGTNFYISELKLRKKTENGTTNVFDGILFELKILGKDFPESEIQTGTSNKFPNIFGLVNKNEEYVFDYKTNDDQKFHEQLGRLFPFIKHLNKTNGSIRIRTRKDRIVIMMNSKMKFLDNPAFELGKSFFNKEYYVELGKQLNTLLFIVESFAHNLEKSEIVERLELKVLETVDRELNA